MNKALFKTMMLLTSCCTLQLQAFKILCIVGDFPANEQHFILNQIIGLIDRGHDVYIYALSKGANNPPNQITTYNLLRRTFYEGLPKNFSVDITMCQFGPLFNTYKALIKNQNLKSRKVITFFRGSDIGKVLKADSHAYDTLFKECDLLLPVCDYFRNILIQAGCRPEKIITHHSAIDCSKFFFKSNTFPYNEPIHIVTTARLVEKKGLDKAILAIAQVKKIYPNIIYTIIGDGPLYSYLQELIASLSLHNTVTMVGKKSQEVVAQILDTAHLFILPSSTAGDGNLEGIPNALKEAMAKGLPVICTYHSGNEELVTNGVSGFLVPENDVPALAEKIEYIIHHPELWSPIGKAARNKIENEFETNKENGKLIAIFEALCE